MPSQAWPSLAPSQQNNNNNNWQSWPRSQRAPQLTTLLFMFPLICVRSDPSMCDIWPEARVKTSPSLVIHWSPSRVWKLFPVCSIKHYNGARAPSFTLYIYLILVQSWLIRILPDCSFHSEILVMILNKIWQICVRWLSQVTPHSRLHMILRARNWGTEAANNWLREKRREERRDNKYFQLSVVQFPLSLRPRSKHKQNSISLPGLSGLVREWQIPVFVYLLSSL